MWHDSADLSEMLGVTLKEVKQVGDEELVFIAEDGRRWKLHHYQDCCESVLIEDVCGDLNDLVGSPLVEAEDVSSQSVVPPYDEDDNDIYRDMSETWTFYKFGTAKGAVTVRWYGTSNGYYSERVDFIRL